MGEHVRHAGRDSLAGWFTDTPSTGWTDPTGQLTHWLFALGDTLAINTLRTLAVVAQRPADRSRALADDRYRTACLLETMRLWPTTTLLARETRREIRWPGGGLVPAGTQVLIASTYQHRDPDGLEHPDTFAPDAAGSPPFVHFGGGRQICPGISLAELTGTAILRVALEHTLAVTAPRLPEDEPLPHMLDFFGIRVAVA
ncbi:Cytochrome P450 [Amycolatopsis sacchari]|uniref:Cytochrome P450 n=1 Tax=Amycolatopsis sacchari TaxID=115433 RepID=A0A1I3KKE5_9PSEU|nr:cytochrome P450 [Amycolatopsis sacchari]SFI72973.1 Cytochrome P450 [Amycolatopsis sacchari]